MRILLIFLSLTFAAELEVEGGLTVTGGIDAQGQPITNVGNPVNPQDAIPMSAVSGVVTNAMSLAGMNPPERIYRHNRAIADQSWSFSVPVNKLWIINFSENASIYLNGSQCHLEPNSTVAFFSGDNLSSWTNGSTYITIYEYSISGSGTDQGMDYVEP